MNRTNEPKLFWGGRDLFPLTLEPPLTNAGDMINIEKKSKNGWGGKRPGSGRPRQMNEEERTAIERARSLGRAALPAVVHFWLDGLKHTCKNPRHDCRDHRLRCANQLANRCGLPTLREIKGELETREMPIQVYDFPDPFVEAGLVPPEKPKRLPH